MVHLIIVQNIGELWISLILHGRSLEWQRIRICVSDFIAHNGSAIGNIGWNKDCKDGMCNQTDQWLSGNQTFTSEDTLIYMYTYLRC